MAGGPAAAAGVGVLSSAGGELTLDGHEALRHVAPTCIEFEAALAHDLLSLHDQHALDRRVIAEPDQRREPLLHVLCHGLAQPGDIDTDVLDAVLLLERLDECRL